MLESPGPGTNKKHVEFSGKDQILTLTHFKILKNSIFFWEITIANLTVLF